MKLRWTLAALGPGLLWTALAHASAPVVHGTPLALSAWAVEESAVSLPTRDEESFAFATAPPRLESVRYRPRRGHRSYDRYDRGPRAATFSQLHVGFFDPEGTPESGFVGGFRVGVAADPHIQVGLDIDWHHRGDRETQVISEGPGPGGTTIITRREFARSSSDLVPVLGFIQVAGDAGMPVIPYFGLGGGYEVLFLSAENFQTGEDFEGTFGGFGWQAWGGIALPLSGRSRANAEVFINDGEVARDVEDFATGETFRETVDVGGIGMRFGLQWGF